VINLVSRASLHSGVGGTPKVFVNLTKGLDRIGYPYVVNQRLDSCRRLWIQDDLRALRFVPAGDVKTVVGPSMYPFSLPSRTLGDYALFVYPSAWPAAHWSAIGLGVQPSAVWPVGVDVDAFPQREPRDQKSVLVYHKHRTFGDLKVAIDALERRRIPLRVIRYGAYREDEFRDVLRETSFAVWVSGTESQGLAMLEALASGVPVVVYDCTRLSQNWGTDLDFSTLDAPIAVTSAPYFDERCGIKAATVEELERGIDLLQSAWRTYDPRQFVIDELALERKARAFVDLWGRWGLTFEEGLRERPRRTGALRLPPTWIAHAALRRLRTRRYFRRVSS
jgi:hypothetical protein